MPEILRDAGSFAALGAMIGLVLLLPLYLSQRRDVERLRRWHELEPERGEPVTAAHSAIAAPASAERSAAERITAERPALERITAERGRLAAEPRWKRLLRRLPEPRHPMMIAAGSFILGAGIFLGTMQVLERGTGPQEAGIDGARAETTVAVLNGTDLSGLAGNVGDDVRVNGFDLGVVTASRRSYSQTVVMFTDGKRRQARQLARALGVKPVQPIDRPSARLAEGADLVVIAGEDRAR